MIEKKYKYIFVVLIVTQCLYLFLTLFNESWPSWRMFLFIENTSFRILDENQKEIDYSVYLTPKANSFSKRQVRRFASFVCRKVPDQKIILVFNESEKFVYAKPNCTQ